MLRRVSALRDTFLVWVVSRRKRIYPVQRKVIEATRPQGLRVTYEYSCAAFLAVVRRSLHTNYVSLKKLVIADCISHGKPGSIMRFDIVPALELKCKTLWDIRILEG